MADQVIPGSHQDTSPDDMVFGHHVVAVIDVLGQSNKLEAMEQVLLNHEGNDPPPKFIDLVSRTFGVVEWVKESVESTFCNFVRAQSSKEQLAELAPDYREAYENVRYCELRTTRFSDSIVCYAPLLSDRNHVTASGVIPLLAATGISLLLCLAGGAPIRCGIDAGILAEFPDRAPYGAALSRAHHIESRVADYPRIVVGKRLLGFLEALSAPSGSSHAEGMNQRLSELGKSMIATDTDGCQIVDYLGKSFAEMTRAGDRDSIFEGGYRFVDAELERYEDEGDTKLIGRYRRLLKYFESRQEYWRQ
jgi:hypothetical protein